MVHAPKRVCGKTSLTEGTHEVIATFFSFKPAVPVFKLEFSGPSTPPNMKVWLPCTAQNLPCSTHASSGAWCCVYMCWKIKSASLYSVLQKERVVPSLIIWRLCTHRSLASILCIVLPKCSGTFLVHNVRTHGDTCEQHTGHYLAGRCARNRFHACMHDFSILHTHTHTCIADMCGTDRLTRIAYAAPSHLRIHGQVQC
jgi:hypothetical protein